MIVAEQKPLDEIKAMIADAEKILILGCGTCVTVCFAGGEKEVSILASQLRMATQTGRAGQRDPRVHRPAPVRVRVQRAGRRADRATPISLSRWPAASACRP